MRIAGDFRVIRRKGLRNETACYPADQRDQEDPDCREFRMKAAIRALNHHVARDARVESVMLPIADGLTIVRKR